PPQSPVVWNPTRTSSLFSPAKEEAPVSSPPTH
ncbi:hypothetical protein GNI_082780, partial [Gregarina niphandrodes]